MRRVVVTGMGIVSSIGGSLGEVVVALQEGRSGVELIPERKRLGFRSSLGGTLKNLPTPQLPKKYLRQMGRGSYLAVPTAQQAIADAGLSPTDIQDERAGIIIANHGNMHDIFEQCEAVHHGIRKLGGAAPQRVMASSVSANLSVLLGTRGYAMTLCTACAAGSSAIGQGYQLIKFGLQDRIICGGVQEDGWESFCHLDAARAYSVREDEPTKASRPFDAYRDGLVPSCGCGLVVLEEDEHARRRGARIYAELLGYATTSDGFDMTVPSGAGAVRCLELALQEAGISAGEVDYVNAHATGTRVGDVVEAQSIAKVFGKRPFVSSTKSMTGHEIAAAGSNELIYTILMMQNDFVAPNINIEEIDEACRAITIVANEAIQARMRVAVSNSYGFGGINTSLVVRREAEGAR